MMFVGYVTYIRNTSYIGCCLFVELYRVLHVYVYNCFYTFTGPRPQLLIMIFLLSFLDVNAVPIDDQHYTVLS